MSGIDDGIYRFTHGAGPVRPAPPVQWTCHETSDRLFWLADQRERAARSARAAAFEEETHENLEIMKHSLEGYIELGFAEIEHETEERFNALEREIDRRLDFVTMEFEIQGVLAGWLPEGGPVPPLLSDAERG